MGIEEKQVTNDQQAELNNQEADTRSRLNDLISSGDVFKSLDLPGAETPKAKKVSEAPQGEEVDEKEQEDTQDQDEPSESEESTEGPTESEESEEDLIPRSKVQKRIDAMTARIKQLEAESAKNKAPEEPTDDLTRKLESMSEQELKQARREARLAQIKNADNEEQVNKLIDLEEKIDQTLRNAPSRFNQSQVAEFQKSAEKISLRAAEDGIDITKAAEAIKKIAMELYQDTPEFQTSVYGQGRALEYAYRHYKQIASLGNSKDAGKSEVNRLKSQVNTLKKRTSLDTKVVKGNMDKTRSDDMRRKAMNGTMNDKLSFIRNDSRFNVEGMIPSEYKEM